MDMRSSLAWDMPADEGTGPAGEIRALAKSDFRIRVGGKRAVASSVGALTPAPTARCPPARHLLSGAIFWQMLKVECVRGPELFPCLLSFRGP